MKKSYLGIDIHKSFCVYTHINADGNLIKRGRFGNRIEEVSDFAGNLNGGEHVVVEPVLNYLWLLDQLEAYVASVHVATPHKVRIIAESKCKTDRYDSHMLAELLRVNFLPESYVVPKHIRALREVLRQRMRLVKARTMFKNRIRHLLFLSGLSVKATDVSSLKAHRELNKLYLTDHIRQSVQQCLDVIKCLNQLIDPLNKQIEHICREVEEIDLLLTIPGMGSILAATVYAEVVDIHRFKSRKAFASYTGLIPSVRASGESVHLGGITRQGSRPLRTALVETAIKVTRYSDSLNRLFMRVQYRSNIQKARVAVARKLAVIIYAMLKNKQGFKR